MADTYGERIGAKDLVSDKLRDFSTPCETVKLFFLSVPGISFWQWLNGETEPTHARCSVGTFGKNAKDVEGSVGNEGGWECSRAFRFLGPSVSFGSNTASFGQKSHR